MTGLRERGGFPVDLNGSMARALARIRSLNGMNVKVRSGSKLVALTMKPGQALLLSPALQASLIR